MQKIKLGKRKIYAFIDDCDYNYISRNKWCAFETPKGVFYARRAIGIYQDGLRLKVRTIYLHREILLRYEREPGPEYVVSHINGNTLDCRYSNLEWKLKKENTVFFGGVPAYSCPVPETELASLFL